MPLPVTAGLRKRAKSPDLGAQPGGRQRVDPAKAAQPGDHCGERAVAELLLERRDQRRPAADEHLDRGEVVNERRLRARLVEAQAAQPAHVQPASRSRRPRSGARGATRSSRAGAGRASDRHGRPRTRGQVADVLVGDRRHERERSASPASCSPTAGSLLEAAREGARVLRSSPPHHRSQNGSPQSSSPSKLEGTVAPPLSRFAANSTFSRCQRSQRCLMAWNHGLMACATSCWTCAA